jgi:hypothetical protein
MALTLPSVPKTSAAVNITKELLQSFIIDVIESGYSLSNIFWLTSMGQEKEIEILKGLLGIIKTTSDEFGQYLFADTLTILATLLQCFHRKLVWDAKNRNSRPLLSDEC